MPNYKGLTGDLELPEFEKPYEFYHAGEWIKYDFLVVEILPTTHMIPASSSAFALICAMLWRMESDRLFDEHTSAIRNGLTSDLIAVGFHAAYDRCLAWEKEAAARLEAEREVG